MAAGVGGLSQEEIVEFLTTEMNLDPTQNYGLTELSQRYFNSGLWLQLLGSGSAIDGLDVNIHDYNAHGDGVTSDTLALQAAIDAVYTSGGGIVSISHKENSLYLIDGPVVVKEGVSLVGDNTSLLSMSKATLLLSGPTARITFGSGSARGGASGHFNIDCNGAGNVAGAIVLTIVQQLFHNVTVHDAAGVGCLVLASQNSFVHSLDINGSGSHDMVVDGGTGGMLFTRCELTTPGAGAYGLKITESAPGGHPAYGYQYGPVHNEWHHCIVEHYGTNDPAGLILVESGTRQVFRSCGISNSSDDTFTSGYQVRVTNDCFPALVTTIVEFNGCNFHGGNTKKYPPFYVQGTNAVTKNTLVVTGQTHIQFSTACFATDGLTVGHLDAHFDYTSVDSVWLSLPGALWFFWKRDRLVGEFYKMPDATGAWAGVYPLQISKDTDAGARLIFTNIGDISWCSGANFAALASIGYNVANAAVAITTGLQIAGKWIKGRTLVTIPSLNYALVIDASVGGPKYFYTINGAVSILSAVITNPKDGQEIEVSYYRVGAQAIVWPTAQYDSGAAPAAPTAGTITKVRLEYLASTNKWYEIGRTINIPV